MVIALLKAAKDIRMKIEDPPHLIKLENFINGWRSEKVKNSFIREVTNTFSSAFIVRRRGASIDSEQCFGLQRCMDT